MNPSALIAEDEPLLAQTLRSELLILWPELHIVSQVADGISAVQAALTHAPDVLFLDVRMPGLSGLDAASELTDRWPQGQSLPLIVFVTAYDEYALPAFEAQAIDYVLKPLRSERLARTVTRLQAALSRQRDDETTLVSLRALLQGKRASAQPPLKLLQASVGQELRMVSVDQVVLLEAADKYVRVFTRDAQELWLRTPLKELLDRLDPDVFWQIHRSTVVRADAIASATRDVQGQWRVKLLGHPHELKVGRLFAHRFRAM